LNWHMEIHECHSTGAVQKGKESANYVKAQRVVTQNGIRKQACVQYSRSL
jgi:hypothetical protein